MGKGHLVVGLLEEVIMVVVASTYAAAFGGCPNGWLGAAGAGGASAVTDIRREFQIRRGRLVEDKDKEEGPAPCDRNKHPQQRSQRGGEGEGGGP